MLAAAGVVDLYHSAGHSLLFGLALIPFAVRYVGMPAFFFELAV